MKNVLILRSELERKSTRKVTYFYLCFQNIFDSTESIKNAYQRMRDQQKEFWSTSS